MQIRLDKILVEDFKRIEILEFELTPLTAIVGANTSGKSSALQAAQLGVSILQAAYKGRRANGAPDFSGTVANDAVLFRPTEHLLDLRKGSMATQNLGYAITYFGFDLDAQEGEDPVKWLQIKVRRGKNANISITRHGDDEFAAVLADGDRPFSILTPGLSGIPMREEWRTKGAMDAAVMHGDANLYLRTVLDHLFNQDLDEVQKFVWRQNCEIAVLPDGAWKKFSMLLERCYSGARVIVDHDQHHDRYVSVDVLLSDTKVTLDMASTGMLQVIQIIAYACFYSPPLLLLDEPDAHLHADSQTKLYEALREVAESTRTRILFASHSPKLIQRLMYDANASVIWMDDGRKVELDEAERPTISLLMELGALSAGAEIFDPSRPWILLTEDKNPHGAMLLAKANGAPENLAVLSYNGCGNLPAARLLASMIVDMRADVRVIIHRDRDFRTEEEIKFEINTARAVRIEEGIDRVFEVFTPLNDIEHSFLQPGHLKSIFEECEPDAIDVVINEVIAFKRDELVNAIRVARGLISSSLYEVPRKRAKSAWEDSGMPNNEPPIQSFLPANGLEPVAFERVHGKKLMRALKPKLHELVGGASQAVNQRIYSITNQLVAPDWSEAFEAAAA